MKIQYLGTGAAEAFPGLFCECPACKKARELGGKNIKTRSCTLINEHILIDLSPDIFAQSMRWKIHLSEIDRIVFTHSHWDHLDDYSLCLRTQHGATILPGRPVEKDCVDLYGNETCGQVIDFAMDEKVHTDRSRIRYHQIPLWQPVKIAELTVTPLKANHKKDELCYIYAITDGRISLLYANDTGTLPEETFAYIQESGMEFDMVSMDCARGTLPGDGHMGLKEDIEMKNRLEEMGAATEKTRYYLNHFSHMCGLTHDEFQKLADEEGMTVAYDGLLLEI